VGRRADSEPANLMPARRLKPPLACWNAGNSDSSDIVYAAWAAGVRASWDEYQGMFVGGRVINSLLLMRAALIVALMTALAGCTPSNHPTATSTTSAATPASAAPTTSTRYP
jgi:hypothetical protein